MLGVKTVIHLTPQPFDDLKKEFECIHIQVERFEKELAEMDLMLVVEMIKEKVGEKKGPIFLMCVNGFLSSAVAASFLMDSSKVMTKELAVTSICQKRYENKEMPGWLYTIIGGKPIVKPHK